MTQLSFLIGFHYAKVTQNLLTRHHGGDNTMNTKNITDFYKEEVPSYASYDLIRKCSSYIDGFKNAHRKIIWTMLENFGNPNTRTKTSQMSATVSLKSMYLHGETNLDGSLCTLAQSFVGANNYPLITGHGNFGTRFSPDPAASRYTFVSISPLVSKLYDKDRPLCKGQMFEGNEIEPAYYVPVFPTLFLNGSDGISTGYSQKIYPRNPKEILKYIRAILNKADKVPHIENALPWFKGFLGETKLVKEKDADGKTTTKILNYGVIEKVNSNTLHITEIPITTTYASYVKFLDGLVEKGNIEDYDDLSDPKADKFEFTIKVKRVFFDSHEDMDSWVKTFNLAKPLNEQLNCIDENNRIREFKDIKEILDAFIKIRLDFYKKRKNYLLQKYMEEIQLDVSKYVWCKGVIDETIHIKNKKKDDIVKQLEKTPKVVQNYGSYNYLLNMPMSSITKEKMAELTEKIKNLKELIKVTQKESIEQMWLADLDEIEKEF